MGEINVGDWCIHNSGWRYEAVGPVERVTAKTFTAPGRWSSCSSRMLRNDCLFAGAEATVKALVERLNSSLALRDEERRNASQRHAERVRELLSEASQ